MRLFIGFLVGIFVTLLAEAVVIDYSQYYSGTHIDAPYNSETYNLVTIDGFKIPQPVKSFFLMGYFSSPFLNYCSDKVRKNPTHYGYGMTQSEFHGCDKFQRFLNSIVAKSSK